jgi:hypothetical protein
MGLRGPKRIFRMVSIGDVDAFDEDRGDIALHILDGLEDKSRDNASPQGCRQDAGGRLPRLFRQMPHPLRRRYRASQGSPGVQPRESPRERLSRSHRDSRSAADRRDWSARTDGRDPEGAPRSSATGQTSPEANEPVRWRRVGPSLESPRSPAVQEGRGVRCSRR